MTLLSTARRLLAKGGTTRSTGIEWTDHTWNPFVGCSRVSEGCKNCYAIPTAARIRTFGSAKHYASVTKGIGKKANWTGKLSLASEAVLRERFKPGELVFVNSMSDFWHPNAQDSWRHSRSRSCAHNPGSPSRSSPSDPSSSARRSPGWAPFSRTTFGWARRSRVSRESTGSTSCATSVQACTSSVSSRCSTTSRRMVSISMASSGSSPAVNRA
ncbi:MAG: DUF5131 family protein, partial [Acidobacteria bacterium]|nr:DUF5131 family protein [Acidobacteriota bacterium]